MGTSLIYLQVITDPSTGRSKGYGFVRFMLAAERDKALVDMNGHVLSNRPIRVSIATARKSGSSQSLSGSIMNNMNNPTDSDPTNTTLFIGGLSPAVTEDQLRATFGQFGDIIYVKIPHGKGCGFVQFVLRTSAENAMVTMQGQVLGNSAIRISWGRSSSRMNNAPPNFLSMGAPASHTSIHNPIGSLQPHGSFQSGAFVGDGQVPTVYQEQAMYGPISGIPNPQFGAVVSQFNLTPSSSSSAADPSNAMQTYGAHGLGTPALAQMNAASIIEKIGGVTSSNLIPNILAARIGAAGPQNYPGVQVSMPGHHIHNVEPSHINQSIDNEAKETSNPAHETMSRNSEEKNGNELNAEKHSNEPDPVVLSRSGPPMITCPPSGALHSNLLAVPSGSMQDQRSAEQRYIDGNTASLVAESLQRRLSLSIGSTTGASNMIQEAKYPNCNSDSQSLNSINPSMDSASDIRSGLVAENTQKQSMEKTEATDGNVKANSNRETSSSSKLVESGDLDESLTKQTSDVPSGEDANDCPETSEVSGRQSVPSSSGNLFVSMLV